MKLFYMNILIVIICILLFTDDLYSHNSNYNIINEKEYFNIVLARPTDKSITIILLSNKDISIYCEYKKSVETIYSKTEIRNVTQGIPTEIELGNLTSNSKYNYHISYTSNLSSGFINGDEHSFQTQRSRGTSFTFTIEADPHPYDKKGCHNLWDIAFANQLNDNPDFMIDLGDTFGDDHTSLTTTSEDMKQLHLDNRIHFGAACHSVPLYFCIGNHEGESGYYLLHTPPNNIGVYGTLWRKYYYPNPEPNNFYSGNTNSESYGIGLPQNYYAWEWGDALFVVLDVYRYSTASDSPGLWDWTLGNDQYNWFKNTLEKSSAKYKFVFAHHVRGYGRGAVALAKYYEWGGYNQKDVWEFNTMRPGWELPIHQLMVNNKVNIFFQGHDHLYAKEELDGIVYQAVPMPSDSTYQIGMLANADAFTANQIDGSGHLRVTVSYDKVMVDYVGAYLTKDENEIHKNGNVRFSYSIKASSTSVKEDSEIPLEYKLEQNYPNPFNPSTIISYQLPKAEHVMLKVFNVLGQAVETLVDAYQQAGIYHTQFSINNSQLSTGIYIYRLIAGNTVKTKKALFIK